MSKKILPEFTSRMSRGEAIAALVYLPVHIAVLPTVLQILISQGRLDAVNANFLCYAIGFCYMLGFLRRFLRRDFDPLCDRPGRCIVEILASYGLMFLGNLAVMVLLMLLTHQGENPNNASVMDLAAEGWGKTAALAIFMAPIVEECLFRAGIFGTLRRYNRWAAYIVAVLAFSAYHVWAYAIADPSYWIYLIQYVPVSILLCRVYERTNSIWSSIFFHMLVNYIALNALQFLESMI